MTAMAQAPVPTGTTSDIIGNVFVERGGEFFRAESSLTSLAVGDRVVALEGGSANISFAGCDLALSDAKSVSILAAPSCAGTFDVTALEIGDVARDASAMSLNAAPALGLTPGLIAAGIAITIISIAALDGDDTPSSP